MDIEQKRRIIRDRTCDFWLNILTSKHAEDMCHEEHTRKILIDDWTSVKEILTADSK